MKPNYYLSCFLFLFPLFSKQEKCIDGPFCQSQPPPDLEETVFFINQFKQSSDSLLKESLFQTAKNTFRNIEDLPERLKKKLDNDQYLMETIDIILKQNEDKTSILKHEFEQEHAQTKVQEQQDFKYAPYGGQAQVKNWDDLYHYFPQLGNKIRLWKLEFKESATKNSDKFEGCANPADIVDWLVPDIEDVKKHAKGKWKRS